MIADNTPPERTPEDHPKELYNLLLGFVAGLTAPFENMTGDDAQAEMTVFNTKGRTHISCELKPFRTAVTFKRGFADGLKFTLRFWEDHKADPVIIRRIELQSPCPIHFLKTLKPLLEDIQGRVGHG